MEKSVSNIIKPALMALFAFAAAWSAQAQQEPEAASADAAAQECAAQQPALPVHAPDGDEEAFCTALWERGNASYGEGDYAGARSCYMAILGTGRHSFKLYYNLANACFKTGATGESILYYKRAAKLAPGNDDVRYNLEIAEAQTKDKIAVVPEIFLVRAARSVRNTMGCTAWSILSLAAFAAMVAGLLLFLLASRTGVRKGGFYGCAAAALLFAVSTWCAAAERRDLLARDEAVVMQSAISVKSSPDNSATDIFVLHEGTTVRILTEVDGWYEIVIADGKKGWAQSGSVERI